VKRGETLAQISVQPPLMETRMQFSSFFCGQTEKRRYIKGSKILGYGTNK
jgi:hypothetical protein